VYPSIELDLTIVERNLLAWQAFAGLPVRAVVKSNGYNWGARAMVAALDPVAAGFCVADADELFALRGATKKPVVLLGAVEHSRLNDVLDAGGVPTLDTVAELEIVAAWAGARGRRPLVRVGILPSAGWSGVSIEQLRSLAPALARAPVDVELWTHLTDPAGAIEQLEAYRQGVELLEAADVRLVGGDVAATAPAAAGHVAGTHLRVGAGLFGASSGWVPGVTCALRVRAPVVRSQHFAAGTRVGYGDTVLSAPSSIAVGRCGYADGFPNVAASSPVILSVGMQYVTVPIEAVDVDGTIHLIDERTDLDALAAAARRGVHEIVTTLGLASQRRGEG